jgi:hypothetical protein
MGDLCAAGISRFILRSAIVVGSMMVSETVAQGYGYGYGHASCSSLCGEYCHDGGGSSCVCRGGYHWTYSSCDLNMGECSCVADASTGTGDTGDTGDYHNSWWWPFFCTFTIILVVAFGTHRYGCWTVECCANMCGGENNQPQQPMEPISNNKKKTSNNNEQKTSNNTSELTRGLSTAAGAGQMPGVAPARGMEVGADCL